MDDRRLGAIAGAELDAIAAAVGAGSEQRAAARSSFDEVIALAGWGELDGDARLPWCRIRHGRPYGCSLLLHRGPPEVRWMLEPMLDRDRFVAGLRPMPGVVLDRYDAIRDLFDAPGPEAPFALWHGAVVDGDARVAHKLYLPLAGRGPERAGEIAREALERLGLDGAWPVPAFRDGRDLPTILSLDLAPASEARIKLYVLHRGARAAELSTGDGAALATAMLGADRPIWWLECTTLAPSEAVTLHLGIPRHIADPGEANERLVRLAGDLGLEVAPYLAARAGLERAGTPARLHFVSIRRDARGPRLAVYVLPRGAR